MQRSSSRRVAPALFALILGLAVAAPAFAQHSAERLRGVLTNIDHDVLTLRAPNGYPVTVILAPDAAVLSVKPARLDQIKPGRFVGTAASPEPGNRWRALEVHIFPIGSHAGEGHRPWNPEPGATMTNATVAAAAVKAGNGKLVLTTGGQRYTIDVPRGTPIVSMSPGTRALLKKGAYVVVNQAQRDAGGAYGAKTVIVSTARNWPPS